MISRLLIANRGEIAVRVARAARELGIVPLGIYSQADERAYHLTFMDDARCVGPAPALESYLHADAVIEAGLAMRADAVHPGYGFLSERAAFARAVTDAGMIFVGPSADAMAAMGSKIEAKRRVREFGVPTIPGYDGADRGLETMRAQAARIGFPLLIKASAGGGGRGMRVVDSADAFDEALESARREALAAFGDDAVLLERYLTQTRHIEFQILGDSFGTIVHFGERECSIQRRHQKIVEESPSVALGDALRAEMGEAAIRAAASVGYTNAGTCEFILDPDDKYYFLEMNARLQVEHPVTELTYGVDLVAWQLRVASGEPITLAQSGIVPRGWSIEGRIYAEDPANHMLPSIGTIARWDPPEGPGIRLDAGVEQGSEVSLYYDPMLAKLIVHAADREKAIARFARALADFHVAGVATNLPLLDWIAHDDDFIAGRTATDFLARRLDESIFSRPQVPDGALLLTAGYLLSTAARPWRLAGVGLPIALQTPDGDRLHLVADATGDPNVYTVAGHCNGRLRIARNADAVRLQLDDAAPLSGSVTVREGEFTTEFGARTYRLRFADPPSADAATGTAQADGDGKVVAPMPGKIVKIAVQTGDAVAPHDLLVILEAMKMEHRIEATLDAKVETVLVSLGDVVAGGAPLVELT